jgi:hypothetical protein
VRPSNKRMQLTKLRAAPVLQAEVPPCAPAGRMAGGTASQLIRSVGRTIGCAERQMVRVVICALVAAVVLSGCSGSGHSDGTPTIAIGPIEVTSAPCQPCTDNRCVPCRGPMYSLNASVRIANSGEGVLTVRTVGIELRQNGTITTGLAEAPTVGSVPTQIAGRSSLELEFNIHVMDGASPAQSVLKTSATGIYDDGMPWQAYAELAVPYP